MVELTGSGAALLTEMSATGARITDDILQAAGADVPQFRQTLQMLITAMDPTGQRTAGPMTD